MLTSIYKNVYFLHFSEAIIFHNDLHIFWCAIMCKKPRKGKKGKPNFDFIILTLYVNKFFKVETKHLNFA